MHITILAYKSSSSENVGTPDKAETQLVMVTATDCITASSSCNEEAGETTVGFSAVRIATLDGITGMYIGSF